VRVLDRWTNIAGFRWDDWNTAGRAQTYQFRSVFDVHETGTAFHASLGTGFRAPALAENLAPFGNPLLRPEESRGWDLGATQRLLGGALAFEGYYFRNDFRDLIQWDPTILPFGGLVNIGRARTHGVELIGRWNLASSTTLNATYTRTDSLNVDSGLPLLRRPRDKGSLGIAQGFDEGRGLATLYVVFVGSRLDADDGSVVLDPYNVVNLITHYQLTPAIRVLARFDNLLDEKYEEVYGYATPGASAFGGVDVQW
jgi:vitamin B12 transporter